MGQEHMHDWNDEEGTQKMRAASQEAALIYISYKQL
jgi:hypothetical protein